MYYLLGAWSWQKGSVHLLPVVSAQADRSAGGITLVLLLSPSPYDAQYLSLFYVPILRALERLSLSLSLSPTLPLPVFTPGPVADVV